MFCLPGDYEYEVRVIIRINMKAPNGSNATVLDKTATNKTKPFSSTQLVATKTKERIIPDYCNTYVARTACIFILLCHEQLLGNICGLIRTFKLNSKAYRRPKNFFASW